LRLGHPLEVAERLERHRREAEPLDLAADFGRDTVERQQVVFEDFDTLKPGGRDGIELFVKRAAEAYGGDRGLHGASRYRLAKWAIMRSASGSIPVNKRNAPTAWNTAIVPPDIVRQPSARAARSSSVSSGK
jgi:hypothetical protein